ncbi:cytochrome P450 [Nocardia jinanensis]|uniref:Cytochrome P450 n=1 Tax=Nocardia jinanensis TaxID=382504 RepID=A0A917RCS7_9NOCA|nr:cytochrome P450 [Nocardia jinanensis]GGL00027.1 cytochrome P450 [Nocardia jinanensis]
MTTTTANTVGGLMSALTTPAGQADPYPLYRELRELGPAAHTPDRTLVVSGYRLASTLLRDHRFLKRPEHGLAVSGFPDWRDHPGLRLMFTSMLVRNPPDHTRLRRLVSGAFTARRVAGLRRAITRTVERLLGDLAGTDPLDFIDAFAFPLPVTVIGELLGVPEADRLRFQPLVRDWAGVLDLLDGPAVAKADAAADEISDYLRDLAAQRRREPLDDLLSALVVPAADGARLDDDELITMAALLFAAGFETTTGLLANGLVALLEHPEQASLLRDDPELAGPATEELLRYDSPVQLLTSRTASEDLHSGGLALSAGQRVVILLGAANRDPDVFPEPDRLRLDRGGEPPLSFGGGVHYCLGAPLARLEAQIALPALLRAFPELTQAGPPVARKGLALHGLTALPVLAGVRAA